MRSWQRGVTLVELVVVIAVVAIAVTSVLGALGAVTVRSADAMVQHQATAIAESYLEEITLKAFADPDGADGEGARALYDDVDDYDGLADTGARDSLDNAVAGLGDYSVAVAVAGSVALPPLAAARVLRIDVTVAHATGTRVLLTGYRADTD